MSSYEPPKSSTWSMSDLKLTLNTENAADDNNDPLIDSNASCSSSKHLTLDHLCRLACIDISHSKVKRSDILKDINGILRCAQTLKNFNVADNNDTNNDTNNDNIGMSILTENNLRDDSYDDSNSLKRNSLFQNAKRVHNNKYFTAPKEER